MQFFFPIAALAAWLIASCMGGEIAERATYDCPELAKDFYGSDIACGYGLASDWKTCGKILLENQYRITVFGFIKHQNLMI